MIFVFLMRIYILKQERKWMCAFFLFKHIIVIWTRYIWDTFLWQKKFCSPTQFWRISGWDCHLYVKYIQANWLLFVHTWINWVVSKSCVIVIMSEKDPSTDDEWVLGHTFLGHNILILTSIIFSEGLESCIWNTPCIVQIKETIYIFI